MEKVIHKVSAKLCAGCEYRAREGAFTVYHCDYASIVGECRLDPVGTCSHYKRDKNNNPLEVKRRADAARERRKTYKEEHKPKSTRPRGRPRKEK